jgi:hypothetical protein
MKSDALRGAISTEEQEAVSAAICEHRFSWCRARLLHALGGACEQGVLLEVIKELLPQRSEQDAQLVFLVLRRELLTHGWASLVKDRQPPPETTLTDPMALFGPCSAGCGRARLDGHLTCGEVGCNESAHREMR